MGASRGGRPLRLAAASVTGALGLWHLARTRARRRWIRNGRTWARLRRRGGGNRGGDATERRRRLHRVRPRVGDRGRARRRGTSRSPAETGTAGRRGGGTSRALCGRRHSRAARGSSRRAPTIGAARPGHRGDARDPGTCQHTLKWSRGPITRVCYTACARMICTTSPRI